MRIRFGLMFQEVTYPEFVDGFEHSFSESSFLVWAEQQLGLEKTRPQEHLRIEQYRQILESYVVQHPTTFFAQSFAADAFSTADLLLQMHDELLLSGWDFQVQEGMPMRLRQFASIAQYSIGRLEAGFSERFLAVENALKIHTLPLTEIYINEPLHLMPQHWQRLFQQLQKQGVHLVQITLEEDEMPNSLSKDLDIFKERILKGAHIKTPLKGDGSLIILQANHDTDAAYFLAKWRSENPQYAPVMLLDRQHSKTLDIAMIQEGLPSFGLQSISLARPMAQLLKLATAFLWEPIDVYKILEFLSLPNKPIQASLARTLADAIARRPGLFGHTWNVAVAAYFSKKREAVQSNIEEEKSLQIAEEQYAFWFSKRMRFSRRVGAPVKDCIQLFEYLKKWALQEIDITKNKIQNLEEIITKVLYQDEADLLRLRAKIETRQQAQISLMALRTQAERLLQVMEVFPEKENIRLKPLELERIIKALEEPTPLVLRPKEVGFWQYFTHTSAITSPTDALIWWNFVETPKSALFSIWYPKERMYLETLGYVLDNMQDKQSLHIWQNKRTLSAVKKQLILVIPKTIQGNNTAPHPFWCDLEAAWDKSVKKIIYPIKPFVEDEAHIIAQKESILGLYFNLPKYNTLQASKSREVNTFLHLPAIAPEAWNREKESFTSLENLIYIPYQWAFEFNIGLKRSSILSVSKDSTIKGNLAHSMIQDLVDQIQSNKIEWNRAAISTWFYEKFPEYLRSEGVTLQMFGKEADRTRYQNELHNAILHLMETIYENGWSFVAAEQTLEGEIAQQKIIGIADLVLERPIKGRAGYKEFCIVDLKWMKAKRLQDQIMSNQDLQLIIYAKLIHQTKDENTNNYAYNYQDWAHSSYYSLIDGKFIARTNLAFKNAEMTNPAIDNKTTLSMPLEQLYIQQCIEIWQKIEYTYLWRMQQLKAGFLALTDNHMNSEAEEIPEVLHMRDFEKIIETVDAKKHDYSIYKSLIN